MAKETKVKQMTYSEQSISSLKGADRVRRRPAVIFGSDGLEGCEHSFFEILANAVDEAREGYGDRIIVTAMQDHSIVVEDFGRGVPLGYNEREGRYNWELVFCELYAGGKYDNNDENAVYQYSLGLNGLGACATQYASAYMEVSSYNGSQLSEISFVKGEPISQGYAQEEACLLGMYVHGLAGDIAAEEYTEIGMTASDLVNQLPAAWKKLMAPNKNI